MLTDAKVRSLKPSIRRQKVADHRGLSLWVEPSGTKTWYLRYRKPDKCQDQGLIGNYPEITPGEARESAVKLRKVVAEGRDPKIQSRDGTSGNNVTVELLANVQPERVDTLGSQEASLLFKKIFKATGRDVASVGGAIASIDLASDELPNGTVMAVEGRREFQDQGTGIATRACKRNGIYKWRSRASAGSTQIKGWSDFLLGDLFGT